MEFQNYGESSQKRVETAKLQVLHEIPKELITKLEKLANKTLPHYITRQPVFSDDNLRVILDCMERGAPFYMTSRIRPNELGLHLGHLMPLRIAKWLQDAFDAPLIVQIADEQQFFAGDTNYSFQQIREMTRECVRNVLAVGFALDKTFVFGMDYADSSFHDNALKMQKRINCALAKRSFGFDEFSNVGSIPLPARESAAYFASSFPRLFTSPDSSSGRGGGGGGVLNSSLPCLSVGGLTSCANLHLLTDALLSPPPSSSSSSCQAMTQLAALLCSSVPALHAVHQKMSGRQRSMTSPTTTGSTTTTTTTTSGAIWLNDTAKQIQTKINKVAFSGGRETVEEHRKLGGDCVVDVTFHYLRWFMEDSARLQQIQEQYQSGELLTGHLKKNGIELISEIVDEFQRCRASITQQQIDEAMRPRLLLTEAQLIASSQTPPQISKLQLEQTSSADSTINSGDDTQTEGADENEGGEETKKEDKKEGENGGGEDVVTPWTVNTTNAKGVDYQKLIVKFGCSALTDELLERFIAATRGTPPHPMLTRRVFFAHRDFDQIVSMLEQKRPFFLYTGRGPSSNGLHLGHIIPFILTKWFQDVLDAPLVIQLTDDEKFLWKDLSLEQVRHMARENAKDIMAFGFDPRKTFIFNNLDYKNPGFLDTIRNISRLVNMNQVKGQFGLEDSASVGKMSFPPIQAAPCFSSSFPFLFTSKPAATSQDEVAADCATTATATAGEPEKEMSKAAKKAAKKKKAAATTAGGGGSGGGKVGEAAGGHGSIPCLIPCAIDQDPYFRMTRDIAPRLHLAKPCLIFSKFLPALAGAQSKMSASEHNTSIYLSDSPQQIRHKIHEFAFSGAPATPELHRERGGNCDTDVSFQYLNFFMEDSDRMRQIEQDFSSGELSSKALKDLAVEEFSRIVLEHQARRKEIGDDVLNCVTQLQPISTP